MQANTINVSYCPSKNMLTDIFTKSRKICLQISSPSHCQEYSLKTENRTGADIIIHRGGVLCNKRLHNYTCLLYVTLVLWILLQYSYSISVYIVVHCTYIRESVNIKKLLLLELLTVHGTGCSLDYSAVPKDWDLRTPCN